MRRCFDDEWLIRMFCAVQTVFSVLVATLYVIILIGIICVICRYMMYGLQLSPDKPVPAVEKPDSPEVSP
jgi:hypothetical protein